MSRPASYWPPLSLDDALRVALAAAYLWDGGAYGQTGNSRPRTVNDCLRGARRWVGLGNQIDTYPACTLQRVAREHRERNSRINGGHLRHGDRHFGSK